MRELPRETRHERGVRGCSAGIERCSRDRCSSQKGSVARQGRRSDLGGMRRVAIVQFFVETTDYHWTKKWGADQKTWPEGPVPPCFAFSKPVSEGLIRELAFKNGYRESRAREITRSHPKVLGLLDYHRLGERPAREDRCFFLRCYRNPIFHVLKDVHKLVLDAVRRLRRSLARRGNRGRKRKRGRPRRSCARRRGLTYKEKGAFIFKHRFLIVKRHDTLSRQERLDLETMFNYLPELRVLRDFVDRLAGLFEKRQSETTAWRCRARLVSDRRCWPSPNWRLRSRCWGRRNSPR